jgi:hypothetical protein
MGLNPNEFKENYPSRRSVRDAELAKAFTANGTLAAIDLGGEIRDPAALENIAIEVSATADGGVGAVTVIPTADYIDPADGISKSTAITNAGIAFTGIPDGETRRAQVSLKAFPPGTFQVRAVVTDLANVTGVFGIAV